MALKSLINGKTSDEISVYDRALQYGDGLFETIAAEDGKLLCWKEHIDRLQLGCNRLNIPMPDQTVLVDEASRLIKSIARGVIKIIISRGRGGRGYALPEHPEPNRIMSVYAWPDYPAENSTSGVNVRICDYRYAKNPTLAGIKHLNRLEQIVARSEWSDTSIADGLMMDIDENVIEGTMSNIFYFIDGTLYTTDLFASGITGIIRQKIIELASDLSIDVAIQVTPLELLMNAHEAFMCNSIIGIWPIKRIAEKPVPVGKQTNRIKQALQKQHFISTLC